MANLPSTSRAGNGGQSVDSGYTKINDNIYCFANPENKTTRNSPQCGCPGNQSNCSNATCKNWYNSRECSSSCEAPNCQNQRFAKRIEADVEVARVEGTGRGILAKKSMPNGTFVGEYKSEVWKNKDFNKSRDYVYNAGDCVYDSAKMGNRLRFVNHSCDPNAECQVWKVPGTYGNVSRLAIITKKDIEKGDEITVFYGEMANGMECKCGAEICAGTVGGRVKKLKRAEGVQNNEVEEAKEMEVDENQEDEPMDANSPAITVSIANVLSAIAILFASVAITVAITIAMESAKEPITHSHPGDIA